MDVVVTVALRERLRQNDVYPVVKKNPDQGVGLSPEGERENTERQDPWPCAGAKSGHADLPSGLFAQARQHRQRERRTWWGRKAPYLPPWVSRE